MNKSFKGVYVLLAIFLVSLLAILRNDIIKKDILLQPQKEPEMTTTIKVEIKDFDTTRCQVVNSQSQGMLYSCKVKFFGSAINKSCPGPWCAKEEEFFVDPQTKSINLSVVLPENQVLDLGYVLGDKVSTENLYINGTPLEKTCQINWLDQSYATSPFVVCEEEECPDGQASEHYNIIEPLTLPSPEKTENGVFSFDP